MSKSYHIYHMFIHIEPKPIFLVGQPFKTTLFVNQNKGHSKMHVKHIHISIYIYIYISIYIYIYQYIYIRNIHTSKTLFTLANNSSVWERHEFPHSNLGSCFFLASGNKAS